MNLVMKKAGMRDDSPDYTCGYTTGYLGMWLSQRLGEYAPALRMTVGCRGPTAPKVFKDVVKPSNVEHQPGLINMGKNAPALRTDGGETEDRYAYRYAYRYARYITARYATARYTTTRYITARYATPDTPQRGPTARVLV